MTLWPRTLLWRSVLLIALVLIVAHLAWLQIFRVSERGPRARQIAQQIVSVVNLTRAALISAQPDKRFELLEELSKEEGIQIYIAEPGEALPPLPDRPFLQFMASDLRRQLGADTRVALTRGGVRGLWVSFRIDEDEYWVLLPRSRIERAEPLRWLWLGALVLALALLGAFLIVARVNRPLRELTRAAEEVAHGGTPRPVTEAGPAEIETLARAFNRMAASLKRAEEERALLLAGVSHDLRTPLARIRLGLEMMDAGGDAALRAGLEQDIADIDAAIGQFLDFARLADGEAALPGGDLNAVVRGAVERQNRAGSTVRLATTPVPPLPLRPLALQRLVTNLVENALRHGGGEVEVATGAGAGVAWIEVRDRGPGVPPGEAERLLQPFTRLEGARTGPGTGLGLAIVDRIAKLHGGSVALLARAGGGLCARVELPLAAAG
jgi:two-component system osmolarity sensor histidine kinase EnvZ